MYIDVKSPHILYMYVIFKSPHILYMYVIFKSPHILYIRSGLRPLYSFDSTQPLGCLGGSVVRTSVYIAKQCIVGSNPTRAALFSFRRKKSCLG